MESTDLEAYSCPICLATLEDADPLLLNLNQMIPSGFSAYPTAPISCGHCIHPDCAALDPAADARRAKNLNREVVQLVTDHLQCSICGFNGSSKYTIPIPSQNVDVGLFLKALAVAAAESFGLFDRLVRYDFLAAPFFEIDPQSISDLISEFPKQCEPRKAHTHLPGRDFEFNVAAEGAFQYIAWAGHLLRWQTVYTQCRPLMLRNLHDRSSTCMEYNPLHPNSLAPMSFYAHLLNGAILLDLAYGSDGAQRLVRHCEGLGLRGTQWLLCLLPLYLFKVEFDIPSLVRNVLRSAAQAEARSGHSAELFYKPDLFFIATILHMREHEGFKKKWKRLPISVRNASVFKDITRIRTMLFVEFLDQFFTSDLSYEQLAQETLPGYPHCDEDMCEHRAEAVDSLTREKAYLDSVRQGNPPEVSDDQSETWWSYHVFATATMRTPVELRPHPMQCVFESEIPLCDVNLEELYAMCCVPNDVVEVWPSVLEDLLLYETENRVERTLPLRNLTAALDYAMFIAVSSLSVQHRSEAYILMGRIGGVSLLDLKPTRCVTCGNNCFTVESRSNTPPLRPYPQRNCYLFGSTKHGRYQVCESCRNSEAEVIRRQLDSLPFSEYPFILEPAILAIGANIALFEGFLDCVGRLEERLPHGYGLICYQFFNCVIEELMDRHSSVFESRLMPTAEDRTTAQMIILDRTMSCLDNYQISSVYLKSIIPNSLYAQTGQSRSATIRAATENSDFVSQEVCFHLLSLFELFLRVPNKHRFQELSSQFGLLLEKLFLLRGSERIFPTLAFCLFSCDEMIPQRLDFQILFDYMAFLITKRVRLYGRYALSTRVVVSNVCKSLSVLHMNDNLNIITLASAAYKESNLLHVLPECIDASLYSLNFMDLITAVLYPVRAQWTFNFDTIVKNVTVSLQRASSHGVIEFLAPQARLDILRSLVLIFEAGSRWTTDLIPIFRSLIPMVGKIVSYLPADFLGAKQTLIDVVRGPPLNNLIISYIVGYSD